MSIELAKVETETAQYKRQNIPLSVYEVRLDGQLIGVVRRAMVTRERKTPGKTYVNARWSSPGWRYGPDKYGARWDAFSRRDGIERLLRDAGKSWSESEELALAAKVVR